MSEHIDNEGRRRRALKEVIRKLHAGHSVEEVKAEFAALLQDVGAGEIAALEQALMEEGLPEGEVKRLCDVHVAVFRDSLEAQERPETIPGHPVHTFVQENWAADKVLERFERDLQALRDAPGAAGLEALRGRLRELRQYEKHYLREENLLFPYLERKDFAGPSKVMWALHDDVRAGWKALGELLECEPADPAALASQLEPIWEALASTIREMFYKEERILYPTALQKLDDREWAAIREQGAELGYSYVEPGAEWEPQFVGERIAVEEVPAPIQSVGEAAGALSLHIGQLTPQQIDLLLNHLPLDVTFVDENDAVRFYSEADRIFPRAPAIIGRKVQLCHPPDSVHRVQRILDDFRAGRRDQAEFWIQMQGRFIHIRYFALRDAEGDYRGTLEVSQDLTRLRALEGERRLLDEDS